MELREPFKLRLQFLRNSPDFGGEIFVSLAGQLGDVGSGGTTITFRTALSLFAARTGRTLHTTFAFGTTWTTPGAI